MCKKNYSVFLPLRTLKNNLFDVYINAPYNKTHLITYPYSYLLLRMPQIYFTAVEEVWCDFFILQYIILHLQHMFILKHKVTYYDYIPQILRNVFSVATK